MAEIPRKWLTLGLRRKSPLDVFRNEIYSPDRCVQFKQILIQMKYLKFISILILLTSVNSVAQKFKAELIFKDGRTLIGLGEPAQKNLIRFRKEKKAKKEFFTFEEVDTLKVYYDFDPTIFVYQRIKGRIYPDVLELANVGKNVIFYRDNTQGYMTFSNGGATNGMGTWRTVNLTHSFVRKPNDDEATHLGSNDWMSKNFKKAASNFFSDCPQLVKKIENRELKKKNLMAIIDFYNNSCD